jgi:hypothetical protein
VKTTQASIEAKQGLSTKQRPSTSSALAQLARPPATRPGSLWAALLAAECTMSNTKNCGTASGAEASGAAPPAPRLRLPLATAADVRRELARLYREGKAGQREAADVSRLANILAILGRLIETSDLEARLQKLEQRE